MSSGKYSHLASQDRHIIESGITNGATKAAIDLILFPGRNNRLKESIINASFSHIPNNGEVSN